MVFLCGIPLLFMEFSIGQYTRLGPVHALAKICPLLKGEWLSRPTAPLMWRGWTSDDCSFIFNNNTFTFFGDSFAKILFFLLLKYVFKVQHMSRGSCMYACKRWITLSMFTQTLKPSCILRIRLFPQFCFYQAQEWEDHRGGNTSTWESIDKYARDWSFSGNFFV